MTEVLPGNRLSAESLWYSYSRQVGRSNRRTLTLRVAFRLLSNTGVTLTTTRLDRNHNMPVGSDVFVTVRWGALRGIKSVFSFMGAQALIRARRHESDGSYRPAA